MARTLSSAMQTAISAKEGYDDVWLIEIAGSGGTLRYATSPSSVAWDSQSWIGIGGVIDFEPPPETSDPSGMSLRLSLSGVDQAVISEVLTNNMRGRDCVLYWGQILTSTGVIVTDPIEAFAGLMNASWEILHTPSDVGSRGTVRVTTTIVSQMARYLFRHQLRTNVNSLREMQVRSTRSVDLGTNPIATTSGSTIITVTDSGGHGLNVGSDLTFSGAAAVGGITAVRINVAETVSAIPSATTFKVDLGGANATSSATGGGSSVVVVYGRDIYDETTPDVFFSTVPDLVGRPIYWGRKGATAHRGAKVNPFEDLDGWR